MLTSDGEAAAEIYSAATVKEQAKICFLDAEGMVEKSPALSRRITRTLNNLAYASRRSFMRPISSEKRGLDGKRVHCALIDELQLALDRLAPDTSVRVVVLAARGRGFCAGHDLKELRVMGDVAEVEALFARCSRMMLTLARLPQAVVLHADRPGRPEPRSPIEPSFGRS
jgi:hypothetical protein